MKQYCRYCSELVVGNGIYCQYKNKELSEAYTKSPNYCKDFNYLNIDAYDFNKRYKPRKTKRKPLPKQLTIFEEV